MRTLYPLLAVLAVSALPLAAQSPEVDQAAKKYQAGDLQGAIAVLEPLKGKPGAHPAALSLLGTLYLDAGRPQDALALLGPIADSGAAGPVILHHAARAALALGDTGRAEGYLERAAAKAPVSPAARDLGILRGSQGKLAESYRLLRPWAIAHPEDQEARLAAAYAAIELERPPEAEVLLASLREQDPKVRLLRGRLELLRRNPRAALEILETLARDAPPALDLAVRRYLAEAHLRLAGSEKAVALLAGKVGDDPSLALLLARGHYRSGNPEEAAAVLAPFARQFLAREPATPAGRNIAVDLALDYGQALVVTSRWNEAIEVLQQAVRLAPQSLQGWQLLGRAQLAAGRRDDATRSMERFRQLQSAEQPNSEWMNELDREDADPTGRNVKQAMSLAAQGRTDEALALIRQEIGLAPDDPRPRSAEVTLLLAAKRTDEALKAAEAALATASGAHLAAMNELAAKLIASGRRDEARALLRKVLEIRPGDPAATANLNNLEQP